MCDQSPLHTRLSLENCFIRPPCANVYHIKSVCDGQPLPHNFFLRTVCDAFNNANDKIINIVCNGNAITNDLTGKIVCDVPVNGNFLEATVWDVHTNGNV